MDQPQTLLPYPDFGRSAACLSQQHLGAQRIHTLMILHTLNGETNDWRNYPATLMWRGHLEALVEYGVAMCDEWLQRGFIDTCRPRIIAQSWGDAVRHPPWLGDEAFHLAQQAALLRLDRYHYRPHFPTTPDNLPYVWPNP